MRLRRYDQAKWYDPAAAANGGKAVTICESLCKRVYRSCKGAFFRGAPLQESFKDARAFCEAQNFDVYADGNQRYPTQYAAATWTAADATTTRSTVAGAPSASAVAA